MVIKQGNYEINLKKSIEKNQILSNDEIIKNLLLNRSINENSTKKFLENFELDNIDPYEFKEMKNAVDLIVKYIVSKKTIGIYGDFDADGLTGTAILVETFRSLGTNVKPFIPHRENEGHGISENGIKSLIDLGCELIITVDTGTNADEIIDRIKNERQIEFVITDHHIPEKEKYNYPILNPVFEKDVTHYSGSGVAWILSKALFEYFNKPMKDGLTSLATIGTIADVAPLIKNNRIIVRKGLEEISKTKNFGINALNNLVGKKFFYEPPESEYISFQLAPRINTPGRIDDAYPALNLLTAPNLKTAHNLSQKIEKMNEKRKFLSKELWGKIQDEIISQKEIPIIFINCSGYPLGLLGPLAGRLVEQSSKPVLCFAEKEGLFKFSSRANKSYDLFSNLNKLNHYFKNFGGHASAAGFSIEAKDYESFKKDLISSHNNNSSKISKKNYDADLEINIDNLNYNLWDDIKKLSPFGEQNPSPLFYSENVTLEKFKRIGHDKNHISGVITNSNSNFNFIAFNTGEKKLSNGKVNCLFSLRTDYWNGKIQKKIQILEIENCD